MHVLHIKYVQWYIYKYIYKLEGCVLSSKQFHRINVGKLVVMCYTSGMISELLSTPNPKGKADKKRMICLKNFTCHSITFDIGKWISTGSWLCLQFEFIFNESQNRYAKSICTRPPNKLLNYASSCIFLVTW